ncbi:MAG: toll/interleukin-1 receptor domain-containing protein [Fuerstiella sp.]
MLFPLHLTDDARDQELQWGSRSRMLDEISPNGVRALLEQMDNYTEELRRTVWTLQWWHLATVVSVTGGLAFSCLLVMSKMVTTAGKVVRKVAGRIGMHLPLNPNESIDVFISYSHDSPSHSRRVLEFANKLREHGVNAEIDQYHTRPPQGWPRWCQQMLDPEVSGFVIVVCTQTYLDRMKGNTPADEGRGVYWEGTVILNYIYDDKQNKRFIPVLLDGSDESHIPVPLAGYSRYRIGSFDLNDRGYNLLYRELTNQPAIKRPPLGSIVPLEMLYKVFRRHVPPAHMRVRSAEPPRKAETTFDSAGTSDSKHEPEPESESP